MHWMSLLKIFGGTVASLLDPLLGHIDLKDNPVIFKKNWRKIPQNVSRELFY